MYFFEKKTVVLIDSNILPMRTYGFECKLLVQLFNRTYTKLCKETAGKSIAQHVAKGSHPKPGKARRVRTN